MKNGQVRRSQKEVLALLKAYAHRKDLCKLAILHNDLFRSGLIEQDPHVASCLVSVYAKCGALQKAHGVLDDLPVRDQVCWTALISEYAHQGQGMEALTCFEHMQCEGISPNAFTFSCILKACGNIGALDKGREIHDKIVGQGLLDENLVLGNALLDMYAKVGALENAQEVLDCLPVRNVVSWSTLIAGYSFMGQGDEALKCFDRMQQEGLSPNVVTLVSLLKACGSVGSLNWGEKIHDEILKGGLLEENIVLGTVLMDMYCKCAALAKARKVLEDLPVRDVISWNVLITGYTQQGQSEEALNCLEKLQHEGFSPNAVTFICTLKACASIGAAEKGKQIHTEMVKQGWSGKYVVLDTALMDMYMKSNALSEAQEVLSGLPVRNLVSWSALVAGYILHGQDQEALKCLEQMEHESVTPDVAIFSSILQMCGAIGAASVGQCAHSHIINHGMLEGNIGIGTALVDMYAKCGAPRKAQCVLDELHVQNTLSWNALIAGYALHGQIEDVLSCLGLMQNEGLSPDAGSFASVLNACSHSGLIHEGLMHFLEMSTRYSITQDLEHHCCLLDLFGRAGVLSKSLLVIKQMPFCDCFLVWHTMLGVCQKWGNVKVGKLAFEHAVQGEKNDSAAYVCVANIYAAADM